MSNSLPYVLVDVFADVPLSGNGVTVFFNWLEKAVMQEITREMRQFESIFLQRDPKTTQIDTRIFTMDEELDYAGHPLLGAAAALHSLGESNSDELTWSFQLKNRAVIVTSKKKERSYHCTLNQGEPQFLSSLTKEETKLFLNALNLKEEDLDDNAVPQVVTTGLPYLIIPIKQKLDHVKIITNDFEKMLQSKGAKFSYVVDTSSFEARSWDNNGIYEDIATGSAAGPLGAYLIKYGFAKSNTEISIQQGRFLNRPSTMTVHVEEDDKGRQTVFVSGNTFITAEGVVYLG